MLCDRYFYDILVRRVWVCENRWTRSLLLSLAPRPTVTLLLTGDPDVIAARKGEVSPDEAAREVGQLATLRKRPGAVLSLDAQNSLDDNAFLAVEGVLGRSTRGVVTGSEMGAG